MFRADNIWKILKDQFEHVHQRLHTTRGNTVSSMAFQHVNMLATQVLVEVKAVKEDVPQTIEDLQPDDNMPSEQHVNSATSDNVQVEILKLLQSIQSTLKDLKSNEGNRNNNNNRKK